MRELSSDRAQEMNRAHWGNVKVFREYDWVQIAYDNHHNGMDYKDLMSKYGMKRGILTKAKALKLFHYIRPKKTRTTPEEIKAKISESRKKYLLANPESHPWKNKDKFQSKPCEYFKQKLRDKSINFVEEYNPLKDRAFSIDIAFPEKMIGIEINGNQHYERNGELKDYYKKRHELIESTGWKLYELHYTLAWNDEVFEDTVLMVNSSDRKIEFDYETYVQEKMNGANKCIDCGCEVFKTSTRCVKCTNAYKRAISISKKPSKEELEKLYNTYPLTTLGTMFNVSGNAIKKWLRLLGIKIENRKGYWQKIEVLKK